MARKLTHYIAPEICDEVEHCMHSFEKHIKRNLADKIKVCIQGSINEAFEKHAKALALTGDESSTAFEKAAKTGRQILSNDNITLYNCAIFSDTCHHCSVF